MARGVKVVDYENKKRKAKILLQDYGYSNKEVGDILGVNPHSVRNWVKKHGRARQSKLIKDLTGQRFGRLRVMLEDLVTPRMGKTCWWCECDCGEIVSVRSCDLLHEKTRSCGCLKLELCTARLTGSNNHGWKGGRRVDKEGYVYVRYPEHPNAQKGGYILEHVKVMSEYLGRSLLPGENVHHKNGDRTDNRLENLELWSSSQPPGQRVQDKVDWAVEILSLYTPEKLAP